LVKKTKTWFTIVAPKMFNERELAKTITSDPNSLINRKISVSLMDLINDFGKYYMKFIFRVKRVEGEKAFTEFDSSECLRDYISRMVLRRVRRVDTIQDLETKDGRKIRVKGLVIIPKRVKTTIKKAVRNKVREMIKSEVEKSTLDDFVKKIISDEIKVKILKEARKTYPIRNFEIRKTEVLK